MYGYLLSVGVDDGVGRRLARLALQSALRLSIINNARDESQIRTSIYVPYQNLKRSDVYVAQRTSRLHITYLRPHLLHNSSWTSSSEGEIPFTIILSNMSSLTVSTLNMVVKT